MLLAATAATTAMTINWWQFLLGLIVVITLCTFFSDTLSKVKTNLKTKFKKEERQEKVEDDVNETKKQIALFTEALVEIFYNEISQNCRRYINELRGVPEDEIESFNRMFKIYSALGGNHGLSAKVEYCNEHLPILPPVVPR